MSPSNNVGKICVSLEKFFNARTGRVEVKPRPVLIIGFENDYENPFDVDYEVLPVSTLKNHQPDKVFDLKLNEALRTELGLREVSYIRTHKTTWSHSKNMRLEAPICNLKTKKPDLFEIAIEKNYHWVLDRSKKFISNLPSTELLKQTSATVELEEATL